MARCCASDARAQPRDYIPCRYFTQKKAGEGNNPLSGVSECVSNEVYACRVCRAESETIVNAVWMAARAQHFVKVSHA